MSEFDELIDRLAKVQTKQELDAMRQEVGAIITTGGKANFDRLQGAFIKAKNRARYSRQRRLGEG